MWTTRHASFLGNDGRETLAFRFRRLHPVRTGSSHPGVLSVGVALGNLLYLYTGVTRGKRLVVLVGQKKAIAIAVRNVSGRRRWSKLAEWLHPSSSS